MASEDPLTAKLRAALKTPMTHDLERQAGKRRNPSMIVKALHAAVVKELFKGRCPCCRNNWILEVEGGGHPSPYELDHVRGRDRPGFWDTWLVCRTCNRALYHRAGHRQDKELAFACYRATAALWFTRKGLM